MSYNDSLVTRGDCFRRRASGCPIPPEAPRRATLPSLYKGSLEYLALKIPEWLGIDIICRSLMMALSGSKHLIQGQLPSV